jgi:hypothetical protein
MYVLTGVYRRNSAQYDANRLHENIKTDEGILSLGLQESW